MGGRFATTHFVFYCYSFNSFNETKWETIHPQTKAIKHPEIKYLGFRVEGTR